MVWLPPNMYAPAYSVFASPRTWLSIESTWLPIVVIWLALVEASEPWVAIESAEFSQLPTLASELSALVRRP